MKKFTKALLRNTDFYNEMMKAYAKGMCGFEYNDLWWSTDDAFMDFARDLKCGNLKCEVEENS